MTNANIPAGWYADPQGTPHQLRWWDGSLWTEHTHPGQQPASAPDPAPYPGQQQGQQPGGAPYGQQGPGLPQQAPGQSAPGRPTQQPYGQQPMPGQPMPGQPSAHPGAVQHQVQQQAGVAPGAPGGGTLFTEPVLVVNQKAKLIEVTNEYGVFDQHGNTLGSVVQVGQSTAKKVLRVVSSLDQYMTHKLEIRDAYGQPQLVLTRPAKILKSKVIVERPDGSPMGEIVQQNAIGKINFAMMVGGRQIGAIKAENWRAWNFAIVDHADTEVARITKTWEGLAKTMFTTADNYVLQIHHQLPDPLLSLVVATALTVDTALKQDARGLG
ncbi:phospholipid scramblase-related protein [Streptomyces sp. NPDC001339]|uniref:phospholipid scramblase-related protein n=1 Tax=Streptomyces sp. NPDC001339 TaxID=3364563 RepID=UPI0036C5776C